MQDAVERKLAERKVPPERVQPPDPHVAVPAIEALRYSTLRENFAALLAASMDSQTAKDTHPAFVEILKQLVSDEAKIIKMPQWLVPQPLADVVITGPGKKGKAVIDRNLSMLAVDAECEHPELGARYVDNLCRLGLLDIPPLMAITDDTAYERLLNYARTKHQQLPNWRLDKKMTVATSFGFAFRHVCV